MRIFILLKMQILAFFHKVWTDLVREVVIAICGLILFALFYYVFNDFIHAELLSVGVHWQKRLAATLAWSLLTIVAFFGGRTINALIFLRSSLLQFSHFLGESPRVRRQFIVSSIVLTMLLFLGPTIAFLQSWLKAWSIIDTPIIGGVCLSGALIGFVAKRQGKLPSTQKEVFLPKNPILCLVVWRLRQILGRSRVIRLASLMLLPFFGIHIYISTYALPLVASFAACFCISLLFASGLSLHFAEDIRHSWLERQSGVSHDSFLLALNVVCTGIGLLLATMTVLVYLLFFPHSLAWQPIVTLGATTFSFPALVPQVFFQIDPRRPALIIMSIFLIGLFTTTAILSTPLGILLFPLIYYYGWTSQQERFYRA